MSSVLPSLIFMPGIASQAAKITALQEAAAGIRDTAATLLEANARDLDEAGADLTESFLDRLKLDDSRIEGMAKALEEIAALPDPVGREIEALLGYRGRDEMIHRDDLVLD